MELPQLGEESTWEEIVIAMIIEDHIEIEDPLTKEDTLVEDPLMEEDPLDLLEDKDHQALKDPLDQ